MLIASAPRRRNADALRRHSRADERSSSPTAKSPAPSRSSATPQGIVHLAAVGKADVETDEPMTTDTIFGVMSMTKPITATALMILVDEGKLSLDDPVEKYIPAFADAKTEDGEPVRGLTRAPRCSRTPRASPAIRAAGLARSHGGGARRAALRVPARREVGVRPQPQRRAGGSSRSPPASPTRSSSPSASSSRWG